MLHGSVSKRAFAQTVAAIVLGATLSVFLTGTALAAPNTLRVATTGADTGSCAAHPCKTIQYAVDQAVPGDTVKVAAGTYHETVAITKAIQIVGAGAKSTKINGAGLDTTGTNYGVVFVGDTGGAASVSGFTITNAYPFSYTGGEPEIVALADQNAADSVAITQDIISEGTADSTRSTDFPIGIDTFKNYAHTMISDNTILGTFQGALLEDNGPVQFTHNTVKNLIANTYQSQSYPGEGAFFLSDLSGSITGQVAISNTFSGYSGYGLIMEAGYNNGNCSSTPCNGSISGRFLNNVLALGGTTGAVGIDLESEFAGNNLTATVTGNRGYVTRPDRAIVTRASSGATISVTQSNNHIAVHS